MKKTKIKNTLWIRGLELKLNLGVPRDERKKIQTVFIDIELSFSKPPSACQSDQLEDTMCYAFLIEKIKENVMKRHFRMIEFLACEIFNVIQPLLPQQTKAMVYVTKFPKVKGLKGHVCFSYGEE